MKKRDWAALAAFACAAAGLRVLQCRTGFDAAGFALRETVPAAVLLPAVLVLCAVYFVLAARRLPSRRDAAASLPERIELHSTPARACGVAGALLVLADAVLSARGQTSLAALLLAVFAAAGALAAVAAVFSLHRSGTVQGVVLLVPVCCLIAHFVFVYREYSADPVLARIYIEILAVAALMSSALELAAFAFRDGSMRVFVPISALGAVLSLAAAAETWRGLASALGYAGCALLELTVLAAVKKNT